MDDTARIKELTKVIDTLITQVPEELKSYLWQVKKDMQEQARIAKLSKDAKRLITAWNKHILPITGVRALDADWQEWIDAFDVTIDVLRPDGSNRTIKVGDTLKEALQNIESKPEAFSKWRKD